MNDQRFLEALVTKFPELAILLRYDGEVKRELEEMKREVAKFTKPKKRR